jgi:hypothetical protein
VLAAHAVWQAAFLCSLYLLATHFQASVVLYVLLYIVISPSAASAVAQALRLPEATRCVAGRLMDAYRTDSCVTYAQPGAPGAFDPAAAAAAADAAQPDAGVQRPPVFVFGCHPAGAFSRGAFTTFAALGYRSPVSKLARVRLAVGSQLLALPLPGVREFLLACGCIPAGKRAMDAALASGCSVAVVPGGFREGGHLNTYCLVLAKRRGFVEAAAAAGALLVPVLCLGEQDAAGQKEPGWWWIKWLVAARPHPIQVVFGKVRRSGAESCCGGNVLGLGMTLASHGRQAVFEES